MMIDEVGIVRAKLIVRFNGQEQPTCNPKELRKNKMITIHNILYWYILLAMFHNSFRSNRS